MINMTVCLNCGNNIKKENKRYCSRNCSIIFRTGKTFEEIFGEEYAKKIKNKIYKTKSSEEYRQKARNMWKRPGYRERMRKIFSKSKSNPKYKKRMDKIWKSKEYHEKMSKITKTRLFERPEIHPSRVLAKHSNKGVTTVIERIMAEILDIEGIKYDSQKVIRYSNKHSGCVKYPDFYIPEYKTIIECDGEEWHLDKEKDKKRDEIILSVLGEDWRIFRFTGKEIIQLAKIYDFSPEKYRV